MMLKQAVLLGSSATKRTDYFMQAAKQEKLPVFFADWKDLDVGKNSGYWEKDQPEKMYFVKIDPPLWESCSLEKMEWLTADYVHHLEWLSDMAKRHHLEFMNHPLAIAELLDKRDCKRRLEQAGLPVTGMLEERAGLPPEALQGAGPADKKDLRIQKDSAEMLMEMMRKSGIHQVFIKPVCGSGAAGISAFRWQPSTERMVLYTCALEHPDLGLVNTKRLRRFSGPEEILPLLNRILKMDCIIERWYAKSEYKGFSYDLRAVVLDGNVDFLLARLSKGPITNLHLNNHALETAQLGLPASVLESAADVCKKAMGCFQGLRSAGIDILLEKGSLNPRIIEMNAQGDLIYQDIFYKNTIYRHQAGIMKNWLDDISV